MKVDYQSAVVLVPQEITVPTYGVCTGSCGRYVVHRQLWLRIKPEVRRQLKKKFTCIRTRGACEPCYRAARLAGTVEDLPAQTFMRRDIFVEEYALFKEQGMTDHHIRERLGMSKGAFDKALLRARNRGDL